MESAKPQPFLTIHSKTYTDYLVTDTSDFVYTYVLHTAHKRHATDPIFRSQADGSRSEVSLKDVTKSSGIRELWIGEHSDKPAKEAIHSVVGEKIVTEFSNNGKRTHSSEITLEVAKSLLKVTSRGESKDQEAEDDNNFWKNPVNQTQQTAFAEDSKAAAVRYGGHISREEVASGDQLAKHNTATDAWIAVEGKVYDVTKYSPIHPGGKKINLGWGKDGTDLFSRRA